MEEGGWERTLGPLSKANAWRAGCFWEDIERAVKVFIKKDGKKMEVDVVKQLAGERQRIWLWEKKAEPPRSTKKTTSRPL